MGAPFSDYKEAVKHLLGFVNYEVSVRWPTYDTEHFDLIRFARMLEGLGSPHKRPGLIHVAGTKGKGSTCALLTSILTAAGKKTGLYTSPHIESFLERIKINGKNIKESEFARLAGEVCDRLEDDSSLKQGGYRTTFEVLTAMALKHFADEHCDAAVIETGLGGRLDATNVVAPIMTIITALGLDHQHILGNTLAHIAREKGGIIKSGIPCVVARQSEQARMEALPLLMAIAEEKGAPLVEARKCAGLTVVERTPLGSAVEWRPSSGMDRSPVRLDLPFAGDHQIDNLATALAGVERLRQAGWDIPNRAVERGVMEARIVGRCEVISRNPPVVLDAAHCPLSAKATLETVTGLWPDYEYILLFSSLSDKNVEDIGAVLSGLPRLKEIILFAPPSPRSLSAKAVSEAFTQKPGIVELEMDPESALRRALMAQTERTVILATGSFYSLAPLRKAFDRFRGGKVGE